MPILGDSGEYFEMEDKEARNTPAVQPTDPKELEENQDEPGVGQPSVGGAENTEGPTSAPGGGSQGESGGASQVGGTAGTTGAGEGQGNTGGTPSGN